MTLTPLGKEIKKKLIDKDMTQVELAEQLGVTKQYITKIITGTRTGDKYLCRIGAILDIDIAKFAAQEGDRWQDWHMYPWKKLQSLRGYRTKQ